MSAVLIPASSGASTAKHPLTVAQADFSRFEPRLGVAATVPVLATPVLDEAPFAMTELAVSQALKKHQWPFLLPTPMSFSWGAIRSLWKHYPHLAIVYCSAHVPGGESDPYAPQSWLALASLHNLSVTLVGSRQGTAPAWRSDAVIFPPYRTWQPSDVLATIPTEPVFLAIDASVLDPSLVMVPAPEPGGLDWERLLNLIEQIMGQRHVVGVAIGGLSTDAPPLSVRVMARLVNWLLACHAKAEAEDLYGEGEAHSGN